MIHLVVIDSNEKTSTYKLYNQDKVIQWIRCWTMQVDIAGSILLVVLKTFYRANRHPWTSQQAPLDIATGTLGIATDDEPQPSVTFVSNGSGTETDFLDRYGQRRESR